MLLQAALSGPFGPDHNPALPVSADALARDAAACVAAGAGPIHLHTRDGDGRERLEAEVVDAVVARVRGACGVPVGVSTGAWIEPDVERRVALVPGWRTPDYGSVNVSEAGAAEVMRALVEAGVGIEAGAWTPQDAEALAATGVQTRVRRVLVEPVDVRAEDAVGVVEAIHAALARCGVRAPRLQHGDGAATWVLIEDAVRRGLDTRVGLEDTVLGPGGALAEGNAALVRAARALGAGARG